MKIPQIAPQADVRASTRPASTVRSRVRQWSTAALSLLLAPSLLLLSLDLRAAAPPMPSRLPQRIPDVHTTSFSGDLVDLPAMLQGKIAILILGFSKGSRNQATLWGRRLPTDYFYSPDVLYFEMPVLEAVPRLLRGAVLRSIKSEVSARSQPHFAPLTTDEQRWRTVVHYNQPDDAYVLVVDSNGLVQAQFQGEPTDASYQEMKRRVEQLQSTSATK